jgi:hypothetical protein
MTWTPDNCKGTELAADWPVLKSAVYRERFVPKMLRTEFGAKGPDE